MKQSVKYMKIFCNLLAAVLVLLFLVYVAPRIVVYFMPFVIGFILSLIANPVVKFLEKRIKIKRKYASALIIILVIAIIVIGCYGIGAALAAGLMQFIDNLPTMYASAGDEIARAFEQLESLLVKIPVFRELEFDKLAGSLQDLLNGLVTGENGEPTVIAISGFARGIPDALVSVVMGFLATYFFIADREKLLVILKEHLSPSFQENVSRIYQQVLGAVGGYFKAQFKIMGIIYVIVLIGLVILDVDYAWLIGFGIAFLDMLPIFGTGTVLCPWAVIKLFSGNFGTAIGMIILYLVCLIVHQLVQPKLVGESVGMDPFVTLFFMYIGYRVRGVLGMIIAIPAGMILINLYKAGAFEHLKWCVKEIMHDFNQFLKIDKQ